MDVRGWSLLLIGALLGCGSEAATPPPSTAAPAPPSSAAPASVVAAPPESTTAPAAHDESPERPTLPAPPPPITLEHARALASDAQWAESAAVYDALFTATPTDARVLAGRGFAILHLLDPHALAAARADLRQARALAGDDARLVGQIDHNLALADTIERGDLPDTNSDCDQAIPLSATIAPSLVAVVGVLIDANDGLDDGDGEIDRPTDEAAARAMLCDAQPDTDRPACDPSAPFITYYDPLRRILAHLVVPLADGGGYAVYVDTADTATYDDRCPSDLVAFLDAATTRRRLRMRSRRIVFVEGGDECDGEDCQGGCDAAGRADAVTIVARDGRHALSLVAHTDDDERTPPAPPAYTEDATQVTAMPCQEPEQHPL